MDAGNMLKPMLARGELRMVGATTLDEYREHIEKDPALERRFQQVLRRRAVSVEDTIAHPARPQGALRGAPQGRRSPTPRWSPRRRCPTATSPRRFLPDKAIDLVDEAASRLRMEIDSRPVEIDELQRAVDRLKMEELALGQGDRRRPRSERLERLRARPGRPAGGAARRSTARWEQEKAGLNRVGELKEQLDELRGQAERAQRDGDLDTASRAALRRDPGRWRRELAEAARPRRRGRRRTPMVKEEVGPDDIADVVVAPGPASRPAGCSRARPRSCCAWRTSSAAAGRPDARPCGRCPTPCAAPAPASPTRTGPPARSCSSARPVSARPSWPRRSPTSCSTTSGRWSAST